MLDDLLGRDEVQEVEQVDRAPNEGVEEDAALPAKRCEIAEVGDPGMGDDQLRAGVRLDSPRSSAAIGGAHARHG